MNVFEAVKQSVTTRQAAEHYGIRVNRNGMACCPFHNDKTPSMKLDKRFHCFGCGADGDVIDFVAALYGLGKKEAAAQLASDFGLAYEDWKPPGRARKPKPRQKSPEEQFREAKAHCFRVLADYLHLLRVWKQGFVSSLALGYNEVEIQRGMTTSSTAIFIPFMTRELRMDGQALYYGMNALSHNVIMADRKKLKSANGMYLGSTGSGKSFAAKRELLNVFLAIPQDRIIIVDPMGEYAPLVRRLGGQVIEIAPDSPHHLNPMDVELNMAAGESPLSMKADFLLSLCELVVGGKEGLQPIEKTVVDRCVRLVYREQALGMETTKTPLLQDLYEELLKQPEPEARRVATALELYCTGSLNLFNHPTNVKTDSRVVCIVLKNMGENLRKIAMHITNEFVSQAVDTNFREDVATWCYFDEFHVLLRDPLTASYFVAVWKMLRKKGCVPSALTQNVKDLLASREIENILDNTDFMILLSQAQSDRAILARQLGISEHQLSYITHSNSGEGLLFYGNVTIPFVDRFPKGEIYNLLTTRPEDMNNETKTE